MKPIDKLKSSLHKMSRLEAFVTIVGSIEPVAAIPQIIKVYTTRSAEDLAKETWWFGLFSDGLWFYWGISSKNMPIIVTGLLWTLFDAAIIYAMYIYA